MNNAVGCRYKIKVVSPDIDLNVGFTTDLTCVTPVFYDGSKSASEHGVK